MGYNNVDVMVSGPNKPSSTYKTKILKGNHNFASQVTDANTKYVIKYDFDLGGESVTIPEGCLLEFDGGAIFNGTLVGHSTILIYNQPLNDILTATLEGTWRHESGVKADEEDITDLNGELKFKDKDYIPANYSGLGRVYLRKNIVDGVNILTQDMFYKDEDSSRVPNTNTIFIIQYDYDLDDKIIYMPANSAIVFDGGSLKNGCLTNRINSVQNINYIQCNVRKVIFEDVFLLGDFIGEGHTWMTRDNQNDDDYLALNNAIQFRNVYIDSNINLKHWQNPWFEKWMLPLGVGHATSAGVTKRGIYKQSYTKIDGQGRTINILISEQNRCFSIDDGVRTNYYINSEWGTPGTSEYRFYGIMLCPLIEIWGVNLEINNLTFIDDNSINSTGADLSVIDKMDNGTIEGGVKLHSNFIHLNDTNAESSLKLNNVKYRGKCQFIGAAYYYQGKSRRPSYFNNCDIYNVTYFCVELYQVNGKEWATNDFYFNNCKFTTVYCALSNGSNLNQYFNNCTFDSNGLANCFSNEACTGQKNIYNSCVFIGCCAAYGSTKATENNTYYNCSFIWTSNLQGRPDYGNDGVTIVGRYSHFIFANVGKSLFVNCSFNLEFSAYDESQVRIIANSNLGSTETNVVLKNCKMCLNQFVIKVYGNYGNVSIAAYNCLFNNDNTRYKHKMQLTEAVKSLKLIKTHGFVAELGDSYVSKQASYIDKNTLDVKTIAPILFPPSNNSNFTVKNDMIIETTADNSVSLLGTGKKFYNNVCVSFWIDVPVIMKATEYRNNSIYFSIKPFRFELSSFLSANAKLEKFRFTIYKDNVSQGFIDIYVIPGLHEYTFNVNGKWPLYIDGEIVDDANKSLTSPFATPFNNTPDPDPETGVVTVTPVTLSTINVNLSNNEVGIGLKRVIIRPWTI